MVFRVVSDGKAEGDVHDVILMRDNWNDWFVWVTQFYAVLIMPDNGRIDLGHVKIASSGMTAQSAHTSLPETFSQLGDEYFSIGQAENYYETLNTLGDNYRDWFLKALRDGAKDLAILDRYQNEVVLQQSLLRDIDPDRVKNRFHRLSNGNAVLSKFAFGYSLPQNDESGSELLQLEFRVKPNSLPASNVHALIGPNGAGKTRCLDLLTRTFLGMRALTGGSAGSLSSLDVTAASFSGGGHGFAGLITVSFSPFDAYGPMVKSVERLDVRYAYVGLIKEAAQGGGAALEAVGDLEPEKAIKTKSQLSDDFVRSVQVCREGARRDRWASALRILEVDPLFAERDISGLASDGLADWASVARDVFKRLSSGHSVVLLTITRLVELVEEKTLVLIDEPEGHLHPPLLAALMRSLSDLLTNRNGVAIVATHSPVVLQEVPKDCVTILNRSGSSSRVDRPTLETYGENVGVLTREVFGLQLVQTGFHQSIAQGIDGRTYDELLVLFQNQLGAEARSLARTLAVLRDQRLSREETK